MGHVEPIGRRWPASLLLLGWAGLAGGCGGSDLSVAGGEKPAGQGVDDASVSDGGPVMPEGAVLLPDGGVLLPDGGVLLPDGGVLQPDGGVLAPDGGVVGPAPEVCGNNLDDDGDGLVDEECSCDTGQTRACYPPGVAGQGVGICKSGLATCVTVSELPMWGECQGPVLPTTELCNGLDDDCDGQTDEGLTRACSSACASGVQTCSAGGWGACSAQLPVAELCNNLDDDCDGQIDEGVTLACSNACESGVKSCSAGGWGSCSARLPSAEVCNGVDDDCDGQIDEGLTQTCSSACGSGLRVCSAGNWGACSAPQPAAEVCNNGKDDDCDGQVDEGCSLCIKSAALTPWQMNLGAGPACWPVTFATHGEPGEYNYASIPPEIDPGWVAHAASNISFSEPSTMCGMCSCRAGGDFTYFQTFLDVPVGYTVSSLVVTILNVDDGVQISIFNSAYPQGLVGPGSYANLGGGSTANLANYIVPGKNRVVLTHVDDCCQVRQIANATISVNGGSLNPCP